MMIRNPRLSFRDLATIADFETRHRVIGIEDRMQRVALVLDAYSWLLEGRGPYAYDDAGYDADVRRMMRELVEAMA